MPLYECIPELDELVHFTTGDRACYLLHKDKSFRVPSGESEDCDGKQPISVRQSSNELLLFPDLFNIGGFQADEGADFPHPSMRGAKGSTNVTSK